MVTLTQAISEKHIGRKLLFIMLILMVLPLASALDNIAKQNDPYDIRVTVVANASIDTVTANITVNGPDGDVLISFAVMQKNTASQDFNYTISGENTTKVGFYDCTVYAFSPIAENKIFSCSFEVNPSGKEYIPEISGPLIFGAILTLMFISTFLLIMGWKVDLFPLKVFLIIMAGLIAIMNIGFVAGSFQEFFSVDSTLSSTFGAVYMVFIVLLSAASVFLLIWIVLVGFKLYRIKRGFFVDPE